VTGRTPAVRAGTAGVAYPNRKGRSGDYYVKESTPGGRMVCVVFA